MSKNIDCLKLKEELQAALLKEREGLSDSEVIEQTKKWLEESDDEMAKLWRRIRKKNQQAS